MTPDRRWDVRLQFAFADTTRPLSVQQLKFQPVGSGRYEFTALNVRAMGAVVAIHAAKRRAELLLDGLGIRKYEVVKVGVELTREKR